ncbi:MAG: dockerin type I repeat-containing protein [Muribaculaceae bacterium]|nr:dockerin type I repeat-containing protein [Muribaculaceae bacterium]
MKKLLMIMLLAVAGVTASGDDFSYLKVVDNNGKATTLNVDGLKITFSDGNMVATTGSTTKSLSLSTLSFMLLTNDEPAGLLGDVDGDGTVGVTDVTVLINYILGDKVTVFIKENADINFDNDIDVVDVTGLINLILN